MNPDINPDRNINSLDFDGITDPIEDPLIKEGDTIIFMNFRADRARQLVDLTDPQFDGFQHHEFPHT